MLSAFPKLNDICGGLVGLWFVWNWGCSGDKSDVVVEWGGGVAGVPSGGGTGPNFLCLYSVLCKFNKCRNGLEEHYVHYWKHGGRWINMLSNSYFIANTSALSK